MPRPLTDTYRIIDAGVTVALKCAQCGEPVLANVAHTCQPKETFHEHATAPATH